MHEAKSIGPTMSAVQISSEYQLDPLDQDLELVVLLVADASEETAGAVNLLSLVAQVKSALDKLSANDDDLQIRLARLAVDLKQKYYAENWFVMTSLSNYRVDMDFPAVRASQLDQGVGRVTYRIDLGAIEPFKTGTELIG